MHTREFPFGNATVFYPEATEDACTAALALDVDPVGMVRGRGAKGGAEDQYVTDRPYVASSLLSVVLRAGSIRRSRAGANASRISPVPRSRSKRGLLPFHAAAASCFCGVCSSRSAMKSMLCVIRWTSRCLRGPSRIFTVTLRATRLLSELLTHLYVLIPVLDDQKHYWVGDDDIDKLLRRGEGWLETHPARDEIVSRYLVHQRGLVRDAIARLTAEEQPDEETATERKDEQEASIERTISLNERRLEAVFEVLKASGASRVIDLGCGEGKLLRRLLAASQFSEIVGMDVAITAVHDVAISREIGRRLG